MFKTTFFIFLEMNPARSGMSQLSMPFLPYIELCFLFALLYFLTSHFEILSLSATPLLISALRFISGIFIRTRNVGFRRVKGKWG